MLFVSGWGCSERAAVVPKSSPAVVRPEPCLPVRYEEPPSDLLLDVAVEQPFSPAPSTLEPYLNVRSTRLSSVSPHETNMLVVTRMGETPQAYLVERPLGVRRQLTFHPEALGQVAFRPGTLRELYFLADPKGDETRQLYRMDRDTGMTWPLSHEGLRVASFRFLDGDHMLLAASENGGAPIGIYRVSSDFSQPPELIHQGEGTSTVFSTSRDGRRAIVQEHLSHTQSTLGVLELDTGAYRRFSESRPGLVHRLALFSPGGERAYVATNGTGDFVGLHSYSFEDESWEPLWTDVPWDIEGMALSGDGNRLVVGHNVDGISQLSLLNLRNMQRRVLDGIPAGVIANVRFANSRRLAFSLSLPTSPSDAYLYDLETAELTPWTKSETGGIPEGRFVQPERIRVASSGDVKVPLWLYRPPGPGPHPTLIWFHGGPEEQARPRFHPLVQYFAVEQKVAVVVPDVRGSTGYGLQYLSSDDGANRRAVLDDVGAILSFIEQDPGLDAERVGAHGTSYGGFVTLAALAHFPQRLKAGSSQVGIPNLVTFLEGTSRERVDRRRMEYGDERQEEMRRFLGELSPRSHVADMRAKLFIAHGLEDSRVPVGEAKHLIQAAREHGLTVWHLLAPDEGHVFTRQTTRNAHARLLAAFFQRYL